MSREEKFWHFLGPTIQITLQVGLYFMRVHLSALLVQRLRFHSSASVLTAQSGVLPNQRCFRHAEKALAASFHRIRVVPAHIVSPGAVQVGAGSLRSLRRISSHSMSRSLRNSSYGSYYLLGPALICTHYATMPLWGKCMDLGGCL